MNEAERISEADYFLTEGSMCAKGAKANSGV